MAEKKTKKPQGPVPGTIRVGKIFPDRPPKAQLDLRALQPQPDPRQRPGMGEMIAEALSGFLGTPGQADLFADYNPETDATPRARGLRTAAGVGSLAGLLNPAMVAKVLPLLKMPARLGKTVNVWEEFKQFHPGAALFSDIQDITRRNRELPGLIAGMQPFRAFETPAGSVKVPVSVMAPDAPMFPMNWPRGARNDTERLLMQITQRLPHDTEPGRMRLIINEILEDFNPNHIYGILDHEANHAAQMVKSKGDNIMRNLQDQNTVGYFGSRAERGSRRAGYLGTAQRITRQADERLTRDQIQAIQSLTDNVPTFQAFGPDPRALHNDYSAYEELIRRVLEQNRRTP
jgi:hypothetical protein